MSTSLHLVVVTGDSLWPGLYCVAHHLSAGQPLARLLIYQSVSTAASISAGEALERLARTAQPELKIELKRGAPEAAEFRAQLDAWSSGGAEDAWVICLDQFHAWEAWGAESWFARPSVSVIHRAESGVWNAWSRDASGHPCPTPFSEFARGATDRFAAADLIRSVTPAGTGSWQLNPPPTQTPPLVPLAQAALRHDWNWRSAYGEVQIEVGAASEGALFQWFVAELVRSMAREGMTLGRGTAPAEVAGGRRSEWVAVHASGRLMVIDTSLTSNDQAPGLEADAEAAWIGEISQAAWARSRLGPLSPPWILVRPALRCGPIARALAQARGLLVIDEVGMSDLPSRLAEFLDLPLPTDGAEIERLLKAHLAGTGRVRLFGPEPALLRQERAAHSDPLYLNADALLDRIQRDRRQNWLLWVQGNRAFFRLPTDDKARPTSDWALLVAGIAGLDPNAIRVNTLSLRGTTTPVSVLEWEEEVAAGDRVRDWLRPFLNARLTFAAAQERFAAKARVLAEAPMPDRPRPVAAPVSSAAAVPPKPVARPHHPPKPIERRPPPKPERTSRESLLDLDQVLDAALNPRKPE
ncbi:MAG: hypothetical protein IT581_13140 [Verrucomicrobiales bacterium]|nr:hypothetical protein [Verrucomicrobiales bacterium]